MFLCDYGEFQYSELFSCWFISMSGSLWNSAKLSSQLHSSLAS